VLAKKTVNKKVVFKITVGTRIAEWARKFETMLRASKEGC
jgi:hypothetical protein